MRRARIVPGLVPVVLAAFLALAGHAAAWWNSDLAVRRKITLDPAAVGAPDAAGAVPVLVRLYDANFQFAAAKDDGSDIRFVAGDDKTPLPFHIERYDAVMSEAFVWVRVPELKPGTAIWLYYGGGSKAAPSPADEKGTYDPDTVLVYHLSETNVAAHDSSGNGNTAKNAGPPSPGALIAGGLRLDGQKTVTIPGTPSLAWKAGGALTWSAWVKPGAPQPNAAVYGRRDGTGSFVVGFDNGVPFVAVGGQKAAAAAPVAPNSWHHLAVVADGAKTTLFLDGEPGASLAAPLPGLSGDAVLGGDGSGPGFVGEIDELEIARAARPAALLKLAAAAQAGSPSKLLAFGPDEQASSWMSGTAGVLLRSLTPDGWAVIVILAFMSVGSWFIMVAKAGYLNNVGRGNACFLREWSRVASDLTVLDGGAGEMHPLGAGIAEREQRAIRVAPLYHIYHIGAEEIGRHLTAGPRGDGKYLSVRAIQAIRATLDGSVVREQQALNRLMVLLTICISGGPFLGLLGTVVGVMITFATIAQAGEVNVNSIAPGIAAALVATVAGLAVAIPALFGYNYLLSRIKDATSNMHVFVDEFVTKMANFYGAGE